MIGDYILQNDWMASNKTNPWPGPEPGSSVLHGDCYVYMPAAHEIERDYAIRFRAWMIGNIACTAHCILYTMSVWACSFWWMPWWGLLVCFVAHWPVDRFRLAGWWMKNISGQKGFATGVMSPWSIVVVDNVYHIATLFVIGMIAMGTR